MEGMEDLTEDLTECPICYEDLQDARLLPCGHTFCLVCLEQNSAITTPAKCSICRTNYMVPIGGLSRLPKNFLAEQVLEAVRGNRRAQIGLVRERNDVNRTPVVPVATNAQTNDDRRRPGDRFTRSYEFVVVIIILCCYTILHFKDKPIPYEDKPLLLKSISNLKTKESKGYLALTVIDRELVSINPETTEVVVRDTDTFEVKRAWTVKNFYSSVTHSLCAQDKSIYIITKENMLVNLSPLGKVIRQWSTRNLKGRPSLTKECNVLFAIHDDRKRIILFNSVGNRIGDITIKLDIGGARLNCAIQLPTGNFAVSFGDDKDNVHGILLIDVSGNVFKVFGGFKGGSAEQVNGPYDLAVDSQGSVLVADHNNHRILLLNSSLGYQRELVSAKDGLRYPHAMFPDEAGGVLYVGGSELDSTKKAVTGPRILVYRVKNKSFLKNIKDKMSV